ncbi:MAG: DUF5665 domain-containing protein [Desulfovibrionaceae bacterium]|nr:DUF5665 domain-containing protein [Desulfovibrionaceae bacterium]
MKQKQIDQLDKLARRLENSGVADYVRLSQNIPKVLWLNFLSGIARGLGFTVGTAIVLAALYKAVSTLISMNIPYLTELLTEFIIMVKTTQ